jgi:flagellar hook protein FlgE
MGFSQGLSGLSVAAQDLDVIGNNVANANTVGFKTGEAQFADVYAASLAGAGSTQLGLGAKVSGTTQLFTQGNITSTNNPLDVAINGGGFFVVSPPGTSTPYYTRNGQFSLDNNNYIVNNNGDQVQGYAITSTGALGPVGPLQVSKAVIAPVTTGGSAAATGVQANINLNSSDSVIASAFSPTDPTTYNHSTALSVYDSLGNANTYTMYFTKTASNIWTVNATVTDTTGGITNLGTLGTLNFNSSGVLTSTNPATLSQTIPGADLGSGGATSGVANLTFPVSFSSSTQYGTSFAVNSLTQDGSASGSLASFNIGADGVITGTYTNGQSKKLGQIALANFANPQGLQPQGNNLFASTSSSGIALNNPPGTGGNGVLQSGATEDSNVDLTAQLVDLITAQRTYQANAQTIKTQDTILQTLVNLQ